MLYSILHFYVFLKHLCKNIFLFRLGGIPVGVILPEVRPVEKIVPPDPADPTSETRVSAIIVAITWILW